MLFTAENFFFITKVLWALFNPVHSLIIVLCLSPVLLLTSWRRLGKYLLGGSAVLFLLIGVLPSAIWSYPLEHYFPRPQLPPQSQVGGIIILGGTIDVVNSDLEGKPVFYTRERLTNAISVLEMYPDVHVIYSGSSPVFNYQGRDERYYARKFFKALNIDRKIIYEKFSRTTYENAHYAKFLATDLEKQWILITSAFHMPRSAGLFQKAGWNIIPYPVDYTPETPYFHTSFVARCKVFNRMMKEYLAIVVFYLLNKI